VSIVRALKRHLRASSLTYRQLADRLGLSESAVKQMFAGGNFSLKRLDRICEVLMLDIAELVDMAVREAPLVEQLDLRLEQELVSDTRLMLVAHCLVNHWSVDEILARYLIDEPALVRFLARLDRMGLIDLLPGNRVRLRLSSSFRWQENGPIERFFRAQVQQEFLRGSFHAAGALQIVKSGYLTSEGQQQVLDRMSAVGDLFDEINRQEQRQPIGRRRGVTMMLATRSWNFTAFADLERKRPTTDAQ
jgi:transcriptional regulator with XRE-family HTH domain